MLLAELVGGRPYTVEACVRSGVTVLLGASVGHELTDWHNLLQGSIGAIIGVIGAYLAARKTIKGQLAAQRTIELEREARPRVVEAMQAIQPLQAQVEYLQTVIRDADDWEAVSKSFAGVVRKVRHIAMDETTYLPPRGEHIFLQLSMSAELVLLLLRHTKKPLRELEDALQDLHSTCRHVYRQFSAYLRDPSGQMRQWNRELFWGRVSWAGIKSQLQRRRALRVKPVKPLVELADTPSSPPGNE